MEGEGRITVALAEAAGRPGAIAALTSADSGPAVRAAEADWREIHGAALAWEQRAGYPPPQRPRSMAEAADRLLEVLVAAKRAASDGEGTRARSGTEQVTTGARTAPRSLRDLPAGST
eukprot:5835536-Pleurochrysis_carterae.AAC.1